MAFCFTSPVTPFYFKNNNLNKFSPLVSNNKNLTISLSPHLIQFECIFLNPTNKLNMHIKEICNI